MQLDIKFLSQDKHIAVALFLLGGTLPWLGKAILDQISPQVPLSSRGLVDTFLSDPTPCGTTPHEAVAKGCRFESYTATWQLPQCYDKDLDEEFRALRPWKFYLDRNGTKEVSLAELEAGTVSAWTTWEFHLWQCAFYWKKEVKVAHGLVSGSITPHQCLDNSLMQDYKYPKDHVNIPYWPRFTSCRPPSDIPVHQFELAPTEQGHGQHGQHDQHELHGEHGQHEHGQHGQDVHGTSF
ncbi:hypothetical protein PpBr36_04828 [Pyricularia pennisetigena]|uniref:hypothetical protein n=1 Tax=Pyricularia pennisetigena TaxID=1578925 RepID=UPI001154F033|nr:hypothetical protein PpBr36_04828 [Pyricularia pennisetigena]TLS26757.1 hypothetical protein PpBr36_04828 [Pyricularia pennisetigena]